MKAKCVNLEELFGDQFRIDVEESYDAERPEFRKQEEPWLTHIVCLHGTIGVWGDDMLVASSSSAGPVANRLKALPFIQVAQDASDGVNVVFPVQHFETVAEIMRPRKRRPRLSEEHKAKLAASNVEFRFQPASRDAPEAQVCEVRGRLV